MKKRPAAAPVLGALCPRAQVKSRTKEALLNCIGIDLHRKRPLAALDEHGIGLFSRRIVNDPGAFVALLGELDGESLTPARLGHISGPGSKALR